jgi:hypothetical protein
MKALALFFDPERDIICGNDDDDGDGGAFAAGLSPNMMMNSSVNEEEEDNNCYYYPYAEAGMFNQRPLPFIIGSRELTEST